MSKGLRELVSKKKRRYNDGDFNLDLSYITPQIIAMGVPAETLERLYRNDINEVARFLETHHSERYKVYNLCAERSYNHARFKDRVEKFAMQDHNPPLIHTIPYFCTSVHKWLQNGPDYVAAIHCKAGKGRTGVMICCYLLYESYAAGTREQEQGQLHQQQVGCTRRTADQVLDLYDRERTLNNKGVTIPSQRRYVYYYSHMLRHNLSVEACPLILKSVTIEGGLPSFSSTPGASSSSSSCCLMFRCRKLVRDCHHGNRSAHRPIGGSDVYELKRPSACGGQQQQPNCHHVIFPTSPIMMNGDVQIVLYSRSKVLARCEKLFHCWFNTFFVLNQPTDTPGAIWRQRQLGGAAAESAVTGEAGNSSGDLYLTLTKAELDKACKSLPSTFCVTLRFEQPDPSASDDETGASPYRPFAYSPSGDVGFSGRVGEVPGAPSSPSGGSTSSSGSSERSSQGFDCEGSACAVAAVADVNAQSR